MNERDLTAIEHYGQAAAAVHPVGQAYQCDVAELVAEVRRLREENAKLRETISAQRARIIHLEFPS